MASQTAINLTPNDPRVICSVPISFGSRSDIDKARGILLEVGGKHAKAKEVCSCLLTEAGSAGLVLTLEVWCADALTAITLRCEILEQATKRFDCEGIGLPMVQSCMIFRDDRHFTGAMKIATSEQTVPRVICPAL